MIKMMIFGFFKAHNKCPKEVLRYAPPFSHVCDFILVYINNLNQEMKSCKVHLFADDTDLLCLSNSINQLNKLVNANLKHLFNWLNANKISLNVKKKKGNLCIQTKQIWKWFTNKIRVKRLYPFENVKYLGEKIYINLSCYIFLKVLNTWLWKFIQILVGSIMLMIFSVNWIEPMLSFSKW